MAHPCGLGAELVDEDTHPCILPPAQPLQPWERYAYAGARVFAAFLTLALALLLSSVAIVVRARYPYPAPAALEQVRTP